MTQEYTFEKGYVVYPDDTSGEIGKKAPYVDHGAGLIPPERYYSKEEADLEWEKMWTKVWTFAGVAQDLKEVGDYFTYDLGPESFIVIRSAPDTIKAFYNVCPHRANRLLYDAMGHIDPATSSIYCIFHGWRFDIDGSTKEIKDEHLFHKETLAGMDGLKEVRCEVWNSLVFINMDPDAMPLEQYLDVIPEHLKNYDMSLTRVYNEMRGVIDANWKVGLEAFIEFYHSDDTHPQALPISATLKTQYDLYKNGMSRMIIPQGYSGDRSQNPDEVTDILKGYVAFFGGNNDDYKDLKGQEYRKALCDTMRKWGDRNGYTEMFNKLTDDQVCDDWNYHVFPTITLNMFSWGVLIQSWTPHPTDPEKHRYRALSMLLPVKDTNQHLMDPASYAVSGEKGWSGEERSPIHYPQTPDEWGTLLKQDMERVPKVQEGIRSRSYDGHRLCESENRLRHYLVEIDKYLGRV
jgi:carnitine monooxygenase subunit